MTQPTDPVLVIAGRPIEVLHLGAAAVFLILLLLVAIALILHRQARQRAAAEAEAALRQQELEERIAGLMQAQAEMSGRMRAMAEGLGDRQSELTRALSERLDSVSHRLGLSLAEQARSTHENLRQLYERMAVIDSARETIVKLTGEIGSLQAILANKQTRGAFGQGRMEAIIQDALPPGGYSFQATLSNGRRPDCLIHLPNGAPDLVIDAKFPLEAWNALRAAETPEARKAAEARLRQDVGRHIADIAERYLIPGETQDTAFLFVPSESVFADLHENFEDVVQKAARARIVIVSPSLLVLSVQVVQAILRDARMREQAHVIQAEVGKLLEDVGRLSDRVENLRSHFARASKDIDEITISSDKIRRRVGRIEAVELGEEGAEAEVVPAPIGRRIGSDA